MLAYLKVRLGPHFRDFSLTKWIGLFLFEFVVVLLGVLCAQLLQQHFAQRREIERFAVIENQLRDQIDSVAQAIVTRGLQTPCINGKLDTVLASLEDGTVADLSRAVKHPPRSLSRLGAWQGDVPSLARKYLDEREYTTFAFFNTVSELLERDATREDALWATLTLAADGGAGMSEIEIAEVRMAAHQLEHAYEGFDRAALSLVPAFELVGAEVSLDAILSQHQGEGACGKVMPAAVKEYRAQVSAMKAE